MSEIKDILTKYKTIAMVGVSKDTKKTSTIVMKYMIEYGFKVYPVNPSAKGEKILGEEVYAKITDIKKNVDIVLSASETTRHPKFNMIKLNRYGFARIYQKTKKKYFRRQNLDKIYNLTTISYVCRPEYILKNTNIFDGKVKINLIPEFRSTDIDNLFDFKVAEYLFKKYFVR